MGVTDTWLSWHHLGTPSPQNQCWRQAGQMPACPCLYLPSSVALGRVTGQATPGPVPSTPTCNLFNLTNTLQLPRWDGARHTNGKRNQTNEKRSREEGARCPLPGARKAGGKHGRVRGAHAASIRAPQPGSRLLSPTRDPPGTRPLRTRSALWMFPACSWACGFLW